MNIRLGSYQQLCDKQGEVWSADHVRALRATRSLFNLGSNTDVTFYYYPDWADEECEVTASDFCIVDLGKVSAASFGT